MPPHTSASETNVCLIWIMRWCVCVLVYVSVRASLCSWWNVNQVKRAARGRLATLAVSLACERATHTHTSAAFVEPKRATRSLACYDRHVYFLQLCAWESAERAPLSLGTGCNCCLACCTLCVCVCVDTDTDTEILQCCSCAATPFVYLLFANKNKKLVAVFGRAALLICASLRYSHSVEFQRL